MIPLLIYSALVQKDRFESTIANLSQLIAILEGVAGIADSEVKQLADFFRAKLRSAVFDTPASERDVQDTIERLLIGRGLQKGTDYDREKGRVKISSKEVIPDFHFPPLRAALEVKFVAESRKRSEVIDQINADIQAYLTAYDHVLFIVYDLGIIRDEIEFRSDLEAVPGITVVVVKH